MAASDEVCPVSHDAQLFDEHRFGKKTKIKDQHLEPHSHQSHHFFYLDISEQIEHKRHVKGIREYPDAT